MFVATEVWEKIDLVGILDIFYVSELDLTIGLMAYLRVGEKNRDQVDLY